MTEDRLFRLMVIARYVVGWTLCLIVVYVLVTRGPALWRDASQTAHDASKTASELPLRLAESRILLTIMNVNDAKNTLFQQDFQLTDGMKDDDRIRIIDGSFKGCKGLYGDDETRCLTLAEITTERQALDILEQRLILILTSAHPEEAMLPSGAERYVPSLWKLLRHTVIPGKENVEEALPMIRAVREIQKPAGSKVSRRLLVGGCGPQSAPDCAESLVTMARKKGLLVLDDMNEGPSATSPLR